MGGPNFGAFQGSGDGDPPDPIDWVEMVAWAAVAMGCLSAVILAIDWAWSFLQFVFPGHVTPR